jgi:hypothetical protein
MHRGFIFPWAMAAALMVLPARADLHRKWHDRIRQGPKMDIVAATFFGTESPEEFLGVTVDADDRIVAYGNSWGPPFPKHDSTRIVGADHEPWAVPLYPPGMEKGQRGKVRAPYESHPNRTGFLVTYAPDLSRIERVWRFGWGVATVSAAEYMDDGGLIIAGRATKRFDPIASAAGLTKTFPGGATDGYGGVLYEGNLQPGDCYVGKLKADGSGFEWVWLLRAHRTPPERLLKGPRGAIVFTCHTLRLLAADGTDMRELSTPSRGRKLLLAISPAADFVLMGGTEDDPAGTGRESWRRPLLALHGLDGAERSRYYDWPANLVGHNAFRLVADSEARSGCFFPNGDVLACVWSRGGNSVAARHPVDLQLKLKSEDVAADLTGADVSAMTHLVRFDPTNLARCSYAPLASCTQARLGGISVTYVRGARDGRLMLAGNSEPFLVQTTTRWYRDPDHFGWDPEYRVTGGGIRVTEEGWPDYIGLGGRGGFSAVFAPDFKSVLWSSATALCEPAGLCDSRRGIVAASTCFGAVTKDERSPLFMRHDIRNWTEFMLQLRTQATSGGESLAKRLWSRYFSQGLKGEILAVQPGKDTVSVALQKRFYAELNGILSEGASFYDEAAWAGCALTAEEKGLIAREAAGKLGRKERAELNRLLLEKGFPRYIFAAPKANRAPVLRAVQEDFGGGYSDGHIYLLQDVEKTQ